MKAPILKVAFLTSSVGFAALLLRRLFGGRRSMDVGAVSDDWLAQQRGARSDPTSF